MSTFQEEAAPVNCPGPDTNLAGKSEACFGCPNQKICADAPKEDLDLPLITERFESIKNVILVMSGKGGVGKSSVSVLLAQQLAKSHQVGIMDVDLTGPSIPCMLGVENELVHQSTSGWTPVYTSDSLCCMSIQFLLPNRDDAVIWRGNKKNGMIKQFLKDVMWDELDYLVIDTPPGTTDEHLSTIKVIQQCFQNVKCLLVSTPQLVSLQDVRKQIGFCQKLKLPILGIVENMSGYQCLHCDQVNCLFESDAFHVSNMCKEYDMALMASLPIDSRLADCLDEGEEYLDLYPDTNTTKGIEELSHSIQLRTRSK